MPMCCWPTWPDPHPGHADDHHFVVLLLSAIGYARHGKMVASKERLPHQTMSL